MNFVLFNIYQIYFYKIISYSLDLSPYVRHTLVNTLVQGAHMWGSVYGTSQTNLQRICSVRSEAAAKG